MKHNRLGKTAPFVSELAFGIMTFGDQRYRNVCTVRRSVSRWPTSSSSVASKRGKNPKRLLTLTIDGTNP